MIIIFIRIYQIKDVEYFLFLENCLEAAPDTKYIYLCWSATGEWTKN